MNLGQILPDSQFGKALTKYAETSEHIVEIGTWHGMGSTLCLQRGMIRPSQRMWTVEPDGAAFRGAKSRWLHETRITWINGHCITSLDLLPLKIDLLLLDGDDISTYWEFMALKGRCHVIALDDTTEEKNKRVLEWSKGNQWDTLEDHPTNRHGWAVIKSPTWIS